MLKKIFRDVKPYIKLKKFQDLWEKHRGNNFTKAGSIFPISVVTVGDFTYGTLNVHYYNTQSERLTIGKYCSIADNVQFFLGGGSFVKCINFISL